jgi:hypothetical protein
MLWYRQITRSDNGVEGGWRIELADDGAAISAFIFIPVETMPDIVSIWSVALPIGGEAGVLFSDDDPDNLALIVMLRGAAELKPRQAGSESPLAPHPSPQRRRRDECSPLHQLMSSASLPSLPSLPTSPPEAAQLPPPPERGNTS